MANRFLGEVTAEHDAVTYTLRFDFNAMCSFEAATGMGAMEAIARWEAGNIDFRSMRALVHAALVQRHPEAPVELAGDILSDDMNVLARLIGEAFPTGPAGAAAGNARAGKAKG